jgi:predicted DNA-binding transcriptional regulator AlpA
MNAITLNIDVGELASALADQLLQRGLVVPQQVEAQAVDPDELWSAAQVREYLGISQTTFYARRATPGFPMIVDRPGQPRWRASEIRAWAIGK